jgi:hypothetical protein
MRFDKAGRNLFCLKQNLPLSYPFYLCLPAISMAFVCNSRIPCPNYRTALTGPDMFPISDLLLRRITLDPTVTLALETRRRERSSPSYSTSPIQSKSTTTHNPQSSMCFRSKSSHSASQQPRAYPHPILLPQRRQNTTQTTLFPAPRESVLYKELMHSCRISADHVSLMSLPPAYLPPSRRQEDAHFFQPCKYTQHRYSQREQNSWHTLRGNRRERIIKVQELQGRWIPEERLGRYL